MATLTVFSTAADGDIQSSSGVVYALARSGGGSLNVFAAEEYIRAGQQNGGGTTNCYESYISFDTSTLTEDATITLAPLLTLTYNSINSMCDNVGRIFQARAHNWGATVTGADFVGGDSLSGKTLLATLTSSGATSGAALFTDVAMAANVNKTGTTYIMLNGKDHIDNIAPATDANEQVFFQSADTAGTTSDPTLVIEYTMPLEFLGRVRFAPHSHSRFGITG